MKTRVFRAMNTEWWIAADEGADLAAAEALVHDAEAHLSRFLPGSALRHLNRERLATDPWLAEVTRRALEAHQETGGAFDIRMADALVAAGYDRSFELLRARAAPMVRASPMSMERLEVTVLDEAVQLRGAGTIDLGGIAKGWTIDRAGALLAESGARSWLVDGGGDIRAAGRMDDGTSWLLGVADGLAVHLEDAAVCTSSTAKRRWATEDGMRHHIIDPASRLPASADVTAAVVLAGDATTADALATAIIADPQRGLAAARTAGAEVMVERHARWDMTPGMARWMA